MHTFTFITPGKVLCASGAATDGRLASEAALLGMKPLLVCGKSLEASGMLAKILATLPNAKVHLGVPPEPSLADCAAAQAAAHGCDSVIAIGGGSVLDVAKAAALPSTIYDYFDGKLAVPEQTSGALPILAMPTTAGTGSEATWVGVYTDKRGATPKKASIRGGAMLPRTVILDATLSVSCPPYVTAYSGMDAFVQAVEAYVSRGANPLTDPLALQAAFDIAEWLPAAFRDGESLEARERMLIASYCAGMALNTARLGLVHGIAHPVGARTGAAHGLLCALLLPPVIRFNLGADLDRYSDLAIGLGAPREDLAAFAEQWLDDFSIPRHLSDLGLQRSDFDAIIAETMVSGSTKANPRTVTESDVREVLEACW
ncbi:iron-containing alcohol dehydrogenase family protein [Armatimonas sp.]|uniref:iron-containing alcohol dehydrogenase family protein n=1 Tax=Armatimonas sp. TaxID=1872638 RepID=UPI0037532D96